MKAEPSYNQLFLASAKKTFKKNYDSSDLNDYYDGVDSQSNTQLVLILDYDPIALGQTLSNQAFGFTLDVRPREREWLDVERPCIRFYAGYTPKCVVESLSTHATGFQSFFYQIVWGALSNTQLV